jgi:DNA-binding transcriptional MerR regulator
MSVYTIAQLSELTGIKPHTIRIWEKRYGLLEPTRTDGNIRRYDDSQLRRLINTVTLLNSGLKISMIAAYSETQINDLIIKKIEGIASSDQIAEMLINQILSSALTYDEAGFEKAFSSAVLRFGVKSTYTKVIYPVLERTGFMWQSAAVNPCQEHFISNLIKRKLLTAIDSIPLNPRPAKKWLLFLPEGEYHEIGLLMAYFLLRSAGYEVAYLGASVPYAHITQTAETYHPTDMLFFIVHNSPKKAIHDYLKKLGSDFQKIKIVVAGNHNIINNIKVPDTIQFVSSVNQFEQLLSQHAK